MVVVVGWGVLGPLAVMLVVLVRGVGLRLRCVVQVDGVGRVGDQGRVGRRRAARVAL